MAERTLPWWRKVLDYAISGIRSFLRPAKPNASEPNPSPAPPNLPQEDVSDLTQSTPKLEAAADPPDKLEEPVPTPEVEIEPTPAQVPGTNPAPIEVLEADAQFLNSTEPLPVVESPSEAGFVTGHDFSRANGSEELSGALAPEAELSQPSPQILDSSPAPKPDSVVAEAAVPIEPAPFAEVALVPASEPVVEPEPEPGPEVSASATEPEQSEDTEADLKGHDFSRAKNSPTSNGALALEGLPSPPSRQILESQSAPEPDQAISKVEMQIDPAATTIDDEPEPVAEAEMDVAVETVPDEIAESPYASTLVADEPALEEAEPPAPEPVDVPIEPEPEPAQIEPFLVAVEPRIEEIPEEEEFSPADTPPTFSEALAPEEQTLPELHQTQELEPQEHETHLEAASPEPVVAPEELPQVEPVEPATEPAEPVAEASAPDEHPAVETIDQAEPNPESQPDPDEEAEPEAPKLNTPPPPAPKTEAELKTAARITAAIKAREEGPDPSPFSILVDQVYDGPLDLLLDLIRKQDIDIYNIPIAKITAQFLAYVNQLKAGDVDVAGEFIYTASLLIHIKSKMLLPRTATGPDEAAEDPRRELVERLLEHERFKNAAQMLQQKQMLEAATWTNPGVREFQDDVAAEPEIAADTVDLVRIFRDILERARNRPVLNVQEDSVTVGQMIQFLTRRLTMEDKPVSLSKLLSNTKSERALIAMFLALLELVRMQAILLRQDRHFTDIFIKKNSGFDAVLDQGLATARDDWR